MTYYLSTPTFNRTQRMLRRMMESEFNQADSGIGFPIDVKAGDEEYVFTALIPGINEEDLNVQVVNNTVTIEGERKDDREEEGQYLFKERQFGKFCRSIALPEPLDAAKAKATFENGVLTLHIPKSEQSKPKSIKINAN